VVESAASGHNDSLAVAAVLAALVLIIRRRPVLSMLALATAILTKVFPLVLAPLWLRLVGWPRKARGWAAVGAAALLGIACTWPYRSDLVAMFTALQKFSNSFIDNASLFLVLRWFSGSMDWARGISAGIVAGMSLWAAARVLDPLRAAYVLFGTILLVSQNTFSWYFVWIIPLLCFFPNPAWLLLTVLQFLSYHVLIDYQAFDRWEFKPWFQLLEYGPSYGLLLWQVFRRGGSAIPDKIRAA
jgi:alpha-1,6-mannosyltransferase